MILYTPTVSRVADGYIFDPLIPGVFKVSRKIAPLLMLMSDRGEFYPYTLEHVMVIPTDDTLLLKVVE